DHVNIAKVLDAGITSDGRPYFAMELVKGIPITAYCNKNRLTPDERLAIFVQVCRAIQHAHQKGIVHRDLKPSNILVALYDGKPIAKVIDFGLAKAVFDQTHLTDRTLFTQYGQVVGTLEYMSPEQAEFNAMDVDTRTDVFSLGVIFFELLTGSTPIGRERLRKEALDRILRIIREEDAPRPSSRLSESGDAVRSISEQRKTEPRKLSLVLKGELDWIAIKALEKDRTRRYDSPSAMADDIQRYLDGDAIEARPPSLGYRFRKAARKNRGLFAAIGSIAAILLVALVGTTTLWTRAERLALEKNQEATRATAAEEDQRFLTKEAQKARDEARIARDAEEDLRVTSQQATARVQLEKGLDFANKGLISEGLGWMARALRSAPPEGSHIEEVIRRNIAAWLPYTPRFIGSLDLEGFVGREIAFSDDGDFVAFTLFPPDLKTANVDNANRLVIARASDSAEVVMDRTFELPIKAIRYLDRLDCFLIALDDGSLVKTASNGMDLGSTRPIESLITDIEVSSTGKVYVSDDEGGIFELNDNMDQARLIFRGVEGVLELSVSARESRLMAIGNNKKVYVVDNAGRLLNRPFVAGGGYAYALDADRCLVACSDFSGSLSSLVRICNGLTGQRLGSVRLTNNTNDLSFDRDSGNLITTDKGLIVTGWDLREFAPIWQYSVGLAPIRSESRNALCASLSVGTKGTNVRIYRVPGHLNTGTVISGPASHRTELDRSISLWLNSKDQILEYEDQKSGKLCCMAFVPGVKCLDEHVPNTLGIGFQPDGIGIWSAQSLAPIEQAVLPDIYTGKYGIQSFQIDGVPFVAVGGHMRGNWIAKFDDSNRVKLKKIGSPFLSFALAWCEESKLLAIGSYDGSIKTFRVSGELVGETNSPLDSEVFSLDLSQDQSEVIASTRLGTVYRYSFPELQRISARRGRFGPFSSWYYGDEDRFVAGGFHQIEVRDRQSLLQLGRRHGYSSSPSLAQIRDRSLVYSSSVIAGEGSGTSVIQRERIPEPVTWTPKDTEQALEQRLGQRIAAAGGVTQLLQSREDPAREGEVPDLVSFQPTNASRLLPANDHFKSWQASRMAYGNLGSELASRNHGATRHIADLKFDENDEGPKVIQTISDDHASGEIASDDAAVAWGLKEKELLDDVNEKAAKGLRVIQVADYTRNGDRFYCAVWKRSEFESLMELGLDRDAAMRKHRQLTEKGYRAVSCKPAAWSNRDPSDRFHLVWSDEPGEPTTLSLGVRNSIWYSGVEVEGSWRRAFNGSGLRSLSYHVGGVAGQSAKHNSIWSKFDSKYNEFVPYFLAEASSNASIDCKDFDRAQRIGLRRVFTALNPILPAGLWNTMLSDPSAGSIWTSSPFPRPSRLALVEFFRGNSEEAFGQLNAITDFSSNEERNTVQLFKFLSQLKLGNQSVAKKLLAELKTQLSSRDASNDEEQNSFINGVMPVLEVATESNDSNDGAAGSWEDRVSKAIEGTPPSLKRVNALVVASLGTNDASTRRDFQRRAVTDMETLEREGLPTETWLQSVYGTLWETPEFQSFARRAEFDIVVSTVWLDRNGKQAVVAEALDFATFAQECARAMKAGYTPKTASIAERAGGRGIVATAIFERDNPDDWLSLHGQEASRRRADLWAAKRAARAVMDWIEFRDPTDVIQLIQPGRWERGWLIREIGKNTAITKEMHASLASENPALLMAMGNAESREVRDQAREIAADILADNENKSAATRSAARWVMAASGDESKTVERAPATETVLRDTPDQVQVLGHNDHNMVILEG
ncbi:MAG: WD40 repeat domain-containing serine/threonine protein kinase, partial [Planctomycetota bacterium]